MLHIGIYAIRLGNKLQYLYFTMFINHNKSYILAIARKCIFSPERAKSMMATFYCL